MRINLNLHQAIGFFLILGSWALISLLGQITELTSLDLSKLLVLHILFSAVQSFGFFIFCGKRNRALLIGNLFVHFCLPLIGSFFVVVYVITVAVSKKMDLLSDFHEEDKALALQRNQKVIRSYGESIRETVNVEPIVETLRSHANPDLKRGAIETLTQISNPQSVALLKECLTDPNSEVRFYASSGLSRIEEKLNQNILKHKTHLQKSPKPSFGDHVRLGKAYYEFVFLAMQDEASLQYYIRQATQHFEQAHAMDPEEHSTIRLLEKVYTRSGDFSSLERLQQKQREINVSNDPMYLAESHFKAGEFLQAQEVISKIDKDRQSFQTVRDVRELWEIHKVSSPAQKETAE